MFLQAVTDTTVELLIQGGAVGLALAALGLIWYSMRLMANHLTDVAKVLGRVTQVLEMVVDRLDRKDD